MNYNLYKGSICLIYSNPGNPSLWALLSRLVPQYHPKKANVMLHTHTHKHYTQPKHKHQKSILLAHTVLLRGSRGGIHDLVGCVFQGGAIAGHVACLSSMTQGKVRVAVYLCLTGVYVLFFCCALCFLHVLCPQRHSISNSRRQSVGTDPNYSP